MDPFFELCVCGRSFTQIYALANHKRSCHKSRKRLSSALAKAKEVWAQRKKPRLHSPVDDLEPPIPPTMHGDILPEPLQSTPVVNVPAESDDSHLSMMERRPWTHRLIRRLPWRYRDLLPEQPPAATSQMQNLPTENSADPTTSQSPFAPSPHLAANRIRRFFRTARNKFGLYRQYTSKSPPSHDPEENITSEDIYDEANDNDLANPSPESYYPYPNRNACRLGDWYWNGGSQKSQASFRDLLDIVGDPQFSPDDVRDAQWDKINHTLANDAEWSDEEAKQAGWDKTPVTILVPFQRHRKMDSNVSPSYQEYTIGNFYHRSLVSVIREKLSNPNDIEHFHYEPYALKWQPGSSPDPVNVYGEFFTSKAFIDAHEALQNSPPEPHCRLSRHVIALMLCSDSTNLTTFGDAKLWPVYLYFGNESKYRRCKPSCHLGNHIAYLQTLPDSFKVFAKEQNGGKAPNTAFMTFCHRELTHAQWKILLDDDFIEAWQHGIVITCCDGIQRRFYPRIFTHSGDYPEKILLASIRNLGLCPCPRCLIPLSRVHNMGMARDMMQRKTLVRIDDAQRRSKVADARRLIYHKHQLVDGAAVNNLLKKESLVPTSNAFSDRLGPLGFVLFLMFVVDLMHDFELGVWRALFIHLLRIVEAFDPNILIELDRRYRMMPSFGGDTIRKFSTNTSELKKLAARDFENLLQCAIPVFDGLLPEPHNRRISQLLFVVAHWHGLAKLRMHNDLTLDVMDRVTHDLGVKLRAFQQKTCTAFQTRELRREADARLRRQNKIAKSSKAIHPFAQSGTATNIRLSATTSTSARSTVAPSTESRQSTTRMPKTLNLNTYKLHALGDYTDMIRRYGTTDSYSTEPAELEHRTAKSRYRRTSRKDFIKQLIQVERRQARLRLIREKHDRAKRVKRERVDSDLDVPYNIGKTQNLPINILQFVQDHLDDPATRDFIPKLKAHLAPRLQALLEEEAKQHRDVDGVSSESQSVGVPVDCNCLFFKSGRMYEHHLLRINYTTYDVRRSQNVINPGTSHRDIMLLADVHNTDRTSHPFWFARVLGIYHVNIVYTGLGMLDYLPRRLDFLWVRWFQFEKSKPFGWEECELDRVSFPPMARDDAFGFLAPEDVLRGCHIMPAFEIGPLHIDKVSLSRLACDSDDWKQYFVNRFLDRDMVMRYHCGLAAGHTYAHHQSPSKISALYCSEGSAVTSDDNEPDEPNADEGDSVLGDGEFEYSLKDHDNEFDESDEDSGVIGDQQLSREGSDDEL